MATSSWKCEGTAGSSPGHHVEYLAGHHFGALSGFPLWSVSLSRQRVTAVLSQTAGKEHQRSQHNLHFSCLQEQQGGSPSHDIVHHKSQGMLVSSNLTNIPFATPTHFPTFLPYTAQSYDKGLNMVRRQRVYQPPYT